MTPHERPLGISLMIWMFWFWAGAIILLVLGLAAGEGPVMMNGESLDRDEALTAVLPVLIPMALAVAGAALALTLSKSWARPAALFPFVLAVFGPVLTGVADVSPVEMALAILALVPILGGLVWYLYFQPGPRAYLSGPPGVSGS